MPAFKSGYWDGVIRLFNIKKGTIYAGLQTHIEDFCLKHEYEVEYTYDTSLVPFSIEDAQNFVKTLNLPFKLHQHQEDAFIYAIRKKRALILSPTASGKSLILYLITRFYNSKTLIVVPTTNLISQLHSDFISYGIKDDSIHTVFAGQDKNSDKQYFICCWQGIHRLPKEWFRQFGLVIVDEADQADNKSLTSIMTKLENCPYRFGVTGTLKGSKTNQITLEGLFGAIKITATTNELMERKILSSLKINILILHYNNNEKKVKRDYRTEIDFLLSHPRRNDYIKNLTLSRKGNTLVLFQFISHGKLLYEKIKKESGDSPVFFIWSKVKGEKRDEIRKIVEEETDAIIIASSVFVRGVNIKSLKHLIGVSPTKARRIILQGIGRTLRKHENKEYAILYDIVDDLSYKRRNNYALEHYKERAKIYMEENFQIRAHSIILKG